MRNRRLGCLTGPGILAAFIVALIITGYAYARGGLLYSPGQLSTQGGRTRGGVTSHAETGGACSACHTAPWDSATMADRCTDCHTEIAEDMRNVATLHGALMHNDPAPGCRHCHPEHRGTNAPLTEIEDLASFPHEALGFSLNVHRLNAAREPFQCADCHHTDISTFTPENCDACHRQMEIGFMTAHRLSFGSACLDCHNGVDRFDDSFDHNVFSFQLTGKHVGLACVQCHVNARGLGDFPVTLQDCYSCHQDDEPHQGQFGFDCSQCHTAQGWIPAAFNGQHTFPLDHGGGGTCATCHTSGFTAYTCYGCHEHSESEIREEHLDEGITNFQNCMECHPTGEKD
jgi:hypothetical protein